MIFIHSECGYEVKIDISNYLLILTEATISENNVVISSINIRKKSSYIDNYKFYCLKCNKHVQEDEIRLQCMYCGDSIEIENVKIPNLSNGIYCERCFNRKFSDQETCRELKNIFNQIILR